VIQEPDPIQNEARRARQARRLPPNAACALCGETDPAVLRQASLQPSTLGLLQMHHVLGEANDEEVVVCLCLTCHAKATAAQLDAGALPFGRAPTCLERIVYAMRSLGSFFQLIADWCRRCADQIASVVRSLDEHLPNWRGLPGIA
jgi:hypothetical protein